MSSKLTTNYTITSSAGQFTITWASTYPSLSFDVDLYELYQYNSKGTYYYFGRNSLELTLLDWTKSTSPVVASFAAVQTAIAALAVISGAFTTVDLSGV